jgi:phosphoserine phosphatase
LLERFGLTNDQVLAVGDGLNDARMLAAAGLSVAFEPKAGLVRQSAQHTISGDLTQILDLVQAKGWGAPPALSLAATT